MLNFSRMSLYWDMTGNTNNTNNNNKNNEEEANKLDFKQGG